MLTPLHLAAMGGHQDVVELLISKHHAVVNVKDEDQQTPLHWAAVCGRTTVMRTLLQHGADLTAIDVDGRNALGLAIEKGSVSVNVHATITSAARCFPCSNVVLEMLNHDKWEDAMRLTWQFCWGRQEGQQTTPMRELIKKMPGGRMLW